MDEIVVWQVCAILNDYEKVLYSNENKGKALSFAQAYMIKKHGGYSLRVNDSTLETSYWFKPKQSAGTMAVLRLREYKEGCE